MLAVHSGYQKALTGGINKRKSTQHMPLCNGSYTRAQLSTLMCGNWVAMVANVDSSYSRCWYEGKIITRDPRLVLSWIYEMGVTQPWTPHLQPCCYIIPCFRCRPPGLQNLVQEVEKKEMERKHSNNHFKYTIVSIHKSHTQSVPHGVTFLLIWCSGKHHLQFAEITQWQNPYWHHTRPWSKEGNIREEQQENIQCWSCLCISTSKSMLHKPFIPIVWISWHESYWNCQGGKASAHDSASVGESAAGIGLSPQSDTSIACRLIHWYLTPKHLKNSYCYEVQ